MHRGRRLGFDRLLVVGLALLLIGDLFLPWQSVSLGTFSYTWDAWHGDKGFLLGALTAALILWAGAPALGLAISARVSEAAVSLALAVLVFAFAAVKNIRDMDSAWGSYLGVVLAAGLVAAAGQAHRRGQVAALTL